jgi:uncharacterized protein with von Willebrand factor type A (vWA) domain
VLCGSLEDVQVFDPAFRAFFLQNAVARDVAPVDSARRRERSTVGRRRAGAPDEDEQAAADVAGMTGPSASTIATTDTTTAPARGLIRTSYSPLDAEGIAPDLAPADPDWSAAASAFVQRLEAGLSRRWRPAVVRGQRFDFRRTLRSSLHSGGEPLMPRWQTRRKRRPRLVLLVDGSRSMNAYAHVALRMAVATALRRVTGEVRLAASGGRGRLDDLHQAWGGGTSIGACLHGLLQRFGERLVDRRTAMIVVSDGLDVGAPAVLRDAMAHLHRQAAAVIWLNPLLETPGYEPTALGMHVARPYVTTFASVTSPGDLLALSRIVRLRS